MGQVLDDGGSHQRKAGTRMFFLMRVGLLRGKPEPRGREFWRLLGELFMLDMYLQMPSMESASKNNVSLFAVCSIKGEQPVTRCSQFSKQISLFDHELPKRISSDVVKAASSFVVRREDVKPADGCGSGGS